MHDENQNIGPADGEEEQHYANEPKPASHVPPHPLLWQETKDSRGNSTFTALSMTWGDDEGNPAFAWCLECVLRANTAVVILDGTDNELLDGYDGTVPVFDIEGDDDGIADAKAFCQAREDELRAKLGEGLPHIPTPEPETPPAVLAEDGFAPTHQVRGRWSPNGGVLRMYRVWKQPDSELEQEREILDQPELDTAIGSFFTQKFVEELVTRLVTGGFGRMEYETPFVNVFMQVELDFLAVSAFTVRLQGKQAREIAVPLPTHDRIMRVVARQMAERRRQMEEKVGSIDIRTLHSEIERNARALGIAYTPPAPNPEEQRSHVLPVALEDIERGGGDWTDPGQKRNGGAK